MQLASLERSLEQDRQCTMHVTLRRICVIIVVVEKPYLLSALIVCLYSYIYYHSRKTRVFCVILYCQLCSVCIYHTSTTLRSRVQKFPA